MKCLSAGELRDEAKSRQVNHKSSRSASSSSTKFTLPPLPRFVSASP